jgi:GDP-4-dehydro-6-deoxy-D-mannose reductase
MRAFVTGASGFVGGWLIRHLEARGDEVAALAAQTDVADTAAVASQLQDAAPEVVYHLAGLAHVGLSWEAPEETFQVNAVGSLHLLEGVRALRDRPRVILVSSAEVYGSGDGSPLSEEAPLRPASPYAASKAAAEFLGLQAHLGRGLEVVRVRPFNHVGPGQAPAFVVAALAGRIAAAEADGGKSVAVGDLSPARDFTDVRDVVRAYRLLAAHGVAGGAHLGGGQAARGLLDGRDRARRGSRPDAAGRDPDPAR